MKYFSQNNTLIPDKQMIDFILEQKKHPLIINVDL